MDRTRGRGFCCRRGFLGLGSGLLLVPFSIPLVDHEDCFAFFLSSGSGFHVVRGEPGLLGCPGVLVEGRKGTEEGPGGMESEKTVCGLLFLGQASSADSGFGEQAAADRIGGGKSRGLSRSGAPCLFLLIPNASSRA